MMSRGSERSRQLDFCARQDCPEGTKRPPRVPSQSRARAIAGGFLLSLLAGCSEELGPTKKELVDLDGRLTIAGLPIRGGWVQFIPIDGAVGDIRSARLNPDGTFHATRVARGRNVVRVVYPPSQPAVDRVFTQLFSPVRPVIEAGKRLDIDLQREALRARAAAGFS